MSSGLSNQESLYGIVANLHYSVFIDCNSIAMGKKEEVKETLPVLGRPGLWLVILFYL